MTGIYEAHPISVFIVALAMLMTPFWIVATYAFSGADLRKGAILGGLWALFGALMLCVCLWDVPGGLGLAGNLIVLVAWLVPSGLLVAFRRWALAEPLSQRWLVALQLWRVIGGVFLIEMARGNVAAVFAWPAGIGDILAGLLALVVLLASRKMPSIPAGMVVAVAVFGIADFVSALFFGVTSSNSPANLFPQDTPSRLIDFPSGMIPLFLVPFAIFFHTLSLLELRRNRP
ncbi:MAG: hypothetical protein AAF747_05070 [Planctomycetota bacterium]